MALSTRLLALRRSPILLKLPPYLSAICILVGIGWLLLLPLDAYSRQTYVSENAILPGQVHTYFGGSEHDIFRAYRHEVWSIGERSDHDRIAGLEQELRAIGLKTATQTYSWSVSGEQIAGTNVYGLLKGPRADATEAMVMIAAWRSLDGELNYSGVALALTLARYFKRWSIWSKDIIVLIPEDSYYGSEAWVSAYHSTSTVPTSTRNISSLPIKAGALQGAVALDYPAGPWGQRFEKLDILYDGINGALPNLDLLNTAVSVASNQMGAACTLHGVKQHQDDYNDRLLTLGKGLLTQSAGHATGPHSAFMPYHVDAITLKTINDGWHDEMSLGRITESVFRSINNLLEHLHQSFFFYVLLNSNRFVSIGNYLPAAMIIAGSFTITALALWARSGKASPEDVDETKSGQKSKMDEMELVRDGKDAVLVPKADLITVKRDLFVPAVLVLTVHLAGLVPLYLLNHVSRSSLPLTLHFITLATIALPIYLAHRIAKLTPQQRLTTTSLSLLLLGAVLSMLSTINFSLAFIVGLLCAPLNFLRPLPSLRRRSDPTMDDMQIFVRNLSMALPVTVLYVAVSPPVVLYGISMWFKLGIESLLVEMARSWIAQGVWTVLVVWGVWWPAWVIGGAGMWCGWFQSY